MRPALSRRRILVAGALSALPVYRVAAQRARYGIRGQQAPPLRVEWWIDAEGRAMSGPPSDLDGKWVFLKCFQSWCPGCHKHGFPTLKRVSDAFADETRFKALAVQTVFEGFDVNTRDKVHEIQQRYDLRIPIGHDAGNPDGDRMPRTVREYRTGGTPWIIIVDPSGIVVYNHWFLDADSFIARLREQLAA